MKMKTNPNDPAFPPSYTTVEFATGKIVEGSSGLTKIELFAGLAMMGLVSKHGCHGYDLRNANLALEQGKAMIDVLNEENKYPVPDQKLNEGKKDEE